MGVSTADFNIDVVDNPDEYDISGLLDIDNSLNEIPDSLSDSVLVGVTAFAEDLDAVDSVSYSLSYDPSGLFSINSDTGEISFYYEEGSIPEYYYSISVLANSTDGSSSETNFDIIADASGIINSETIFTLIRTHR